MPKSQHSKDRLYITATEWAYEYGGKKRAREVSQRQLPFDSCALSLQQFETPVCTTDGVVFDILHIVPFLKKHKCNPLNSEPMRCARIHSHASPDDAPPSHGHTHTLTTHARPPAPSRPPVRPGGVQGPSHLHTTPSPARTLASAPSSRTKTQPPQRPHPHPPPSPVITHKDSALTLTHHRSRHH